MNASKKREIWSKRSQPVNGRMFYHLSSHQELYEHYYDWDFDFSCLEVNLGVVDIHDELSTSELIEAEKKS